MQVDVYILGAVHAELPTCDYEDAVRDVGDVDGACDLAADYERVFDVSEV